MKEQFELALQGLLNFDDSLNDAETRYNQLFKQMITASMQICTETDFDALLNAKKDEVEKKFGAKVVFSEEATDTYRKLREVVRFEMARESILAGLDYEVCCTETNFKNVMGRLRPDLEKIVPADQKEVVDAMGYSLYSDFTKYFVCTTFDMVADERIYQMAEFRPLQLNAMGKELRTSAKVIQQQQGKPQKSEIVTEWFSLMMMLPSFLFKKLYAVSFTEMFCVPQSLADKAAHMYNIFQRVNKSFVAGDEYSILMGFLAELNLGDCFTVRPKLPQGASAEKNKPILN